jgi:very-short-patch-repair endonuclease
LKITYNPYLKERARELRNNSTLGEILLWKKLKGKQCYGFDFHRQKPILNYIVDFYCSKLNLIIEIDGYSHNFKTEEDKQRDLELTKLGLTILRFSEGEVRNNLDLVLNSLATFIENKLEQHTPASPLFRGETEQG